MHEEAKQTAKAKKQLGDRAQHLVVAHTGLIPIIV